MQRRCAVECEISFDTQLRPNLIDFLNPINSLSCLSAWFPSAFATQPVVRKVLFLLKTISWSSRVQLHADAHAIRQAAKRTSQEG